MSFEIGEIIRAIAETDMPDEVGAQNVWDWVRMDSETTSPSDADVTAAIATKITEIYGLWAPSMADVITVVSTTNYKMGYELGKWVVDRLLGVEPIGVVGGTASEVAPHGVCGLINLPTLRSKVRGRRFFPGPSEDSMLDGIFSGTAVTNLLAAGTAYLQTVIVNGIYELEPRLLASDGSAVYMNSVGANGTPAYQRRRKPGVGS